MRESGILMHITSLPGPYGIGTMGAGAFRFLDFLKQAGQGYWQILPLSPTGFGDSLSGIFYPCRKPLSHRFGHFRAGGPAAAGGTGFCFLG